MRAKAVLSISLWLILMVGGIPGAWGQTLEDYTNEGAQRYNRSDFRGAIEAWEQGLALAKEQGHLQATRAFLNNLGVVYEPWRLYQGA